MLIITEKGFVLLLYIPPLYFMNGIECFSFIIAQFLLGVQGGEDGA